MRRAPYWTTAKFDSVCPETSKAIKKGDMIAYFPACKKAFHAESPSAGRLRVSNFNQAWAMPDADY